MLDVQTGNRIVFNGEICSYRELSCGILGLIDEVSRRALIWTVLLKLYALSRLGAAHKTARYVA